MVLHAACDECVTRLFEAPHALLRAVACTSSGQRCSICVDASVNPRSLITRRCRFSAKRSSRTSRRGSRRRLAVQDESALSDSSGTAGVGRGASGPLPPADSAQSATGDQRAASVEAGGPASGFVGLSGSTSASAPAQNNALMKASLESDDGGPLFSDSAAQRLEPAELPNPKCVETAES